MKYISLIIFLFLFSCMAQYPNTRYTHNDFDYYIQRKDTLTGYIAVRSKTINIGVWQTEDGKYHFDYPFNYNAQTQFDSAKYYKSKQTYWEKKYDKEFKRLNRTGHKNDISESLLMYQDSCIYYKLLLDNYKK